jgi:hypothetical protein
MAPPMKMIHPRTPTPVAMAPTTAKRTSGIWRVCLSAGAVLAPARAGSLLGRATAAWGGAMGLSTKRRCLPVNRRVSGGYSTRRIVQKSRERLPCSK